MNPLIFFIVIIAVNALLRNSKNQKKAHDAKMKTQENLTRVSTPAMMSKEEQIQMERERIFKSRRIGRDAKGLDSKNYRFDDGELDSKDYKFDDSGLDSKDYKFNDSELDIKNYKVLDGKKKKRYYDDKEEIKPKSNKFKIDVKEDILKGIIFSEILSEPKSRK